MNARADAKTRRRVAGSAALAVVVALSLTLAAVAPADEAGSTHAPRREYLFVQNARSGSLVPVAGHAGRYTLTLRHVDPHALYFSDRPSRETGVMPQEALLGALFGKTLPAPNAAITLSEGREDADVLAVELTNPRYDAKRRTLRYDARRLRETSTGLRHLDDRLDRALPRRFGAVSLFIDDGTSYGVSCSVSLLNASEGPMLAASTSTLSTDIWDPSDPRGIVIPGNGKVYPGGAVRAGAVGGCSFDVIWAMSDGSPIEIQTTNTTTDEPPVWTCTVVNVQSYSCTAFSVQRGPALHVSWLVRRVG
jgi:hypothetical protein